LTNSAQPAASSDLIDVRQITGVFRRRLVPMLIVAAIVFGLALLAYSLQKPEYEASARVAIDRQRSSELVTVDRNQPNITADSGTVDTEVQVIQSPAVAGAVVDRLKLATRPGYGFPEDASAVGAEAARARAIEVVRNNLEVQREGLSYAIAVTFKAKDPVLARDVVNGVVDAYVNGGRNDQSQRREQDIQQLSDRLGQLRSDVISAETAVAQYRAATNMNDLESTSSSLQSGIAGLNSQLATARAEQAAAQARAAASQGGAAALDSPVIRQLRTEEARLSAQLTDLAGRYGPTHPARTAVERQLGDIQSAIGQELSRVRANNQSEVNAAQRSAAAIQSAINQSQGRLLAGNNASVRLAELERNAESSRALYQAFLDRYRQSMAAQGTERSNANIIAMATVPSRPTSPNAAVFIVGGLIGAIVLGLGTGLALEFREQGFRSRKQLEDLLQLPALGAIPDLKSVAEARGFAGGPAQISQYITENQDSLVAECYRSIRAALKIGRTDQLARSIVVTSSLAGEGKTTTALSLARSVASSGLKVLLVDCDVRRRSASRELVDSVERGVIDVLKGTSSPQEAILQDQVSGAHLLLQNAVARKDYDLITSREMKALIDQLSGRFDLIILDTPPVLPVADARALAAMADAALLVVRWRKTSAQVATQALRELDQAGARIVGSVLSQVDIRRSAMVDDDVHYYKPYAAVS
jgi:capsular exopolysaccharide synthesis family protein